VNGCREMLDSSKDSLKLDAMKRIIAMLAKVNDPFRFLKNVITISPLQAFCIAYIYCIRRLTEISWIQTASICGWKSKMYGI
jgi:hypothetical protein